MTEADYENYGAFGSFGGTGNGSFGGNGTSGGYGDYGSWGDPELKAQTDHILWLVRTISMVFFQPILVLGLVGNTLVLILIAKRSLKSSTYTYLSALSVFDSLYLFFSILIWTVFAASGGTKDMRKIIGCNFTYFMTNTTKEISAWLLVAVSVERTLVVYMPTKAKSITSVVRARVAIGVIIACDVIMNWLYLGGLKTDRSPARGFVDTTCAGRNNVTDAYGRNVQPWVNSSMYSYIPSILLFAFNAAIIVKFTLAARTLKIQVAAAEADDNKKNGGKKGGSVNMAGRTMAKNSKRMTIMGVTLSLTFLVLSLPNAASNIYFTVNMEELVKDTIRYYNFFLLGQLLSVLNHVNHAINFALYCLTSAKFRQDLLVLLRCKRRGQIEGSVTEQTFTDG